MNGAGTLALMNLIVVYCQKHHGRNNILRPSAITDNRKPITVVTDVDWLEAALDM